MKIDGKYYGMAEKRCDKSIEYTSFGIIGRNIVGDYGGNECYNTSINWDLHRYDIKDFWDIPIEKNLCFKWH